MLIVKHSPLCVSAHAQRTDTNMPIRCSVTATRCLMCTETKRIQELMCLQMEIRAKVLLYLTPNILHIDTMPQTSFPHALHFSRCSLHAPCVHPLPITVCFHISVLYQRWVAEESQQLQSQCTLKGWKKKVGGGKK